MEIAPLNGIEIIKRRVEMQRVQNTPVLKKVLANLLVVAMLFALVITVPTVANAAAKPSISKKSQNILVGEDYDFNIKNKIKGSTYTWKSSNKKVATVDKKGVVTGIKKGTATITCVVKAPKKTYELSAKVAIKVPATKFVINNKVEALNLGQKYDLNRTLTPKTSNDLTTWTTSNKKIANPNSKGLFTALKEGKVTITGKTLSGKTDKVTIEVVDKAGTVATQKELDKLLGSGVALITIQTDEKVALSIKEGDYTKQTLIVDAPNADIVNEGQFKSIEIKQIKADTWTEKAKGNKIVFDAPTGRIVVAKDAEVSIEVVEENSKVVIENNGTIEELVVAAKAEVTINGTSKTPIPVTATKKEAKIIANVPLELTVEAKIVLVLGADAIGTVVHVANRDLIPVVQGAGHIKVLITEGDTVKEEVVIAETPSTGGGTYIPGPGPGPGPISPELVSNTNGKYVLSRNYNEIKSINVMFGNIKVFTINETWIALLEKYLTGEEETVTRWKAIDKKITESVTTYNLIIEPVSGEPETKTVTFPNDEKIPSEVRGRTYKVTVKEDDKTVIIETGLGIFELAIEADNKKVLNVKGTYMKDISLEVTYR